MFFKKKYKDFVDLSVGRVYFKPVINKILSRVEILSYQNNELNTGLYILLMERELVCLSRRKHDKLTLNDSKLLRDKTREILVREGVITIEKPKEKEANIMCKQDVEWFDQSANNMRKKYGLL